MPEADDRNNDMPKTWGELFRRGVEALGGVLKTFDQMIPSSNSSSQTGRDTDSTGQNSNGSWPMPSATDEPPSTSSTSSDSESASPVTSNGSLAEPAFQAMFDASFGSQIAEEREVTVILHLTTYGTPLQARQSVSSMLRGAAVRGANILAATYNGEEIPEREYDPKTNPWKTVE